MSAALRRSWRPLRRGVLFFLLYWLFTPRGLWRFDYALHLVESSVFGLVAAFVPWRQGWRTFVAVSFFAIGAWQLVGGASGDRKLVVGSGIVSLLIATGFSYRAWMLSRFANPS